MHLRLVDPAQRPAAERLLCSAVGSVALDGDPAGLAASSPTAARAASLVAERAEAGVQIADFSYAQPNLDEVFLALTGDVERTHPVLVGEELGA